MRPILEQLCDIPIGTSERFNGPSPTAVQDLKTRTALLEQLRARLTPEENAMLNAYFEMEEQSGEDFAIRKFQYGFCLGVSLMLEVLEGRQQLLR